jgi:hypothetical protein
MNHSDDNDDNSALRHLRRKQEPVPPFISHWVCTASPQKNVEMLGKKMREGFKFFHQSQVMLGVMLRSETFACVGKESKQCLDSLVWGVFPCLHLLCLLAPLLLPCVPLSACWLQLWLRPTRGSPLDRSLTAPLSSLKLAMMVRQSCCLGLRVTLRVVYTPHLPQPSLPRET